MHALVLTLKLVIPHRFQREDHITSGNKQELVAVAAFGHEEATGARNKRRGLGRDWETE